MKLSMRKMQEEDLNEVVDLVDRSFQAPVSMKDAFPMIFSKSNRFSYLLTVEGKIVSFIGVVPSSYQNYDGVFIGAVATDPDYQGKGYLSQLFTFAMADLQKSGLDYAFISGGGKIYRQHGAKDFGSFYQYDIRERSSELPFKTKKYQGEVEDFLSIYHLLSKDKDQFPWGIQDLQEAIHYQSWAQVSSHEVETYLLWDMDEEVSFLTYAYRDQKGTVVASAGNKEALYDLISYLNFKYDIESSSLITKEKIHALPYQKVRNQGTIVLWNEAIDPDIFPYTGGYHFI